MADFFDRISRILATSMSRSQAIKLILGGIVGIGLASTASAADTCSPPCPSSQKCCTGTSVNFCCPKPYTCCGNTCCQPTRTCVNGTCRKGNPSQGQP